MKHKKKKLGYSSFWITKTPTNSPMYFAEKLYDLRNYCHGVFKVKDCGLGVSYKSGGRPYNNLDSWFSSQEPLLFDAKKPSQTYNIALHGNPKPFFLDLAVGTAIFDAMVGNYIIFPALVPTFRTVAPGGVVGYNTEYVPLGNVIILRDSLDVQGPHTRYFCQLGTFPRKAGEAFRRLLHDDPGQQYMKTQTFNFVHQIVSSKIAMLAMEKDYPGWNPYFQKFYTALFKDMQDNLSVFNDIPNNANIPMMDYIFSYNSAHTEAKAFNNVYESMHSEMCEKLKVISDLIADRAHDHNFVLPTYENNWVFHLSLECYSLLMDSDADVGESRQYSCIRGDGFKPAMDSRLVEQVDNIPEGSSSIELEIPYGSKIDTVTTDIVWLPEVDWFKNRGSAVYAILDNPSVSKYINNGYELGELLCRKLAYIGEPEEVNSIYKTKGKIHKNKLHRVGMGLDDFFKETYTEIYPDSTIYLSVDFSGSMAQSHKWEYCVTMLVAFAYVSKKISTIRVVCDLRNEGEEILSNVVIFDSNVSALEQLEAVLRVIRPSGGTPEALLYEFPCRYLEKVPGKKYFITLTDGKPSPVCNVGDRYQIEKAHEVYQRIKAVDGEMLAYFIGSGEYDTSDIFQWMYGDTGKMYNPTELYMVVEDVVAMIKKTSVDLVH